MGDPKGFALKTTRLPHHGRLVADSGCYSADRLLDLKMSTPEIGEGKRFDRINRYLELDMEETEKSIARLSREEVRDWDELNELFVSLLK